MNLKGAVKLDRFSELFSFGSRYNVNWRDVGDELNGYVYVEIDDISNECLTEAKIHFPELKVSYL